MSEQVIMVKTEIETIRNRNRNKQLECMLCLRNMRSDNIKRHMLKHRELHTLDENEITKLMKIIEDLKKQGKTIILVTHDIHLAWNYAERLIIMKDGKIEIDGPTDTIMQNEDKLRGCNITVPNIAKLYNKYLSLK